MFMRKDALISIINKKEALGPLNKEEDSLKIFLESPYIKLLGNLDNVYEKDLRVFLSSSGFAFVDIADVIGLFKQLTMTENLKNLAKREKQGPSKKSEPSYATIKSGDQNISLPSEVWSAEISQHFEPESAALWAQTSSSFYHLTQPALVKHWQNKLIEAGCPVHLLKELIKTQTVKNYKRLYDNYCRYMLRQNDPYVAHKKFAVNVHELWQLLCLSGESKAIAYAFEDDKLYSSSTSEIYHWPAVCYVALAGNLDAVKILLMNDLYSKDSSLLLSIGLSANLDLAKYSFPKLLENPNRSDERALLLSMSYAFQVNNLEVANYVRQEWLAKLSDQKLCAVFYDTCGRFSFITACSGSVNAINFLFKSFIENSSLNSPNKYPMIKKYAAGWGSVSGERFDNSIYAETNCALFGACMSGNLDAIKFVLERASLLKLDLLLFTDKKLSVGFVSTLSYDCALVYAIKSGNNDAFNLIASEVFKQNPSLDPNEFFLKALTMAAKTGSELVFMHIMPLISSDTQLNPGQLFLDAAYSGSCPILKYLMDKFPALDLESVDANNYNVLDLVVLSRNPAAIIFIRQELSRQGIDFVLSPDVVRNVNENNNVVRALEEPLDMLAPELDESFGLKR